jgi:hypothetical protein
MQARIKSGHVGRNSFIVAPLVVEIKNGMNVILAD